MQISLNKLTPRKPERFDKRYAPSVTTWKLITPLLAFSGESSLCMNLCLHACRLKKMLAGKTSHLHKNVCFALESFDSPGFLIKFPTAYQLSITTTLDYKKSVVEHRRYNKLFIFYFFFPTLSASYRDIKHDECMMVDKIYIAAKSKNVQKCKDQDTQTQTAKTEIERPKRCFVWHNKNIMFSAWHFRIPPVCILPAHFPFRTNKKKRLDIIRSFDLNSQFDEHEI